jgi:hypothetical protein
VKPPVQRAGIPLILSIGKLLLHVNNDVFVKSL